MGHIFISYSHKDKDYVEKLEKKLIEKGFDVWIDHRIDHGSQWPKEIEKQLDACDAFIVVVSENAYESKWVQNEVARADRKGKPFFPLLLSGEAWLSFESIQYEKVSANKLPSKAFYERLGEVTSRIIPPPPPPSKEKKILLISGGVILLLGLVFGLPPLIDLLKPEPTPTPTSTSTPTATIIASDVPSITPEPDVTHTPTPEAEAIETWVRSADGMVMSFVPAGAFQMGSNDFSDEEPVHTVYLDAFWIDQTEITNAMFLKFVGSTGYQTDLEKFKRSVVYDGSTWVEMRDANWRQPNGPGTDLTGKDDHPVVHMTWNDAQTYCQWAGGRLLTEAEWEKAARGTDERRYPWGNTTPSAEVLNFDLNIVGTVAVASYEDGRSPYELYDMAGNVWEWVSDWYMREYYKESPSKNPVGPYSGDERVFRGGAWDDTGVNATTTTRGHLEPDASSSAIGFRCAVSP